MSFPPREIVMTSEVAIINKSAVSVAADSAVTIGKKVYRNANKIFNLRDSLPIGIMIYGYAEYCGIPWETIIKIFRKKTANMEFKTVEDCLNYFMKFIENPKFIDKQSEQQTVFNLSNSIATLVVDNIKSIEDNYDLKLIIDAGTKHFTEEENKIDIKMPNFKSFKSEYGEFITEVFRQNFNENGVKYINRCNHSISKLVYSVISSGFEGNSCSGLVFFGFGEDEIMPCVLSRELGGVFNNQVRSTLLASHKTDKDKSAAIIPFADSSFMRSFIEDISPQTKKHCLQLIKLVAENVADKVIKDNFSPSQDEMNAIKAINNKTIEDLSENIEKEFNNYIYKKSINPIIKSVENLPKEDLSTLAESLVELSALKKATSQEIESIGGPVDVCIVTKGDGFIWIKRKHYFNIDNNINFKYREIRRILGGSGKETHE